MTFNFENLGQEIGPSALESAVLGSEPCFRKELIVEMSQKVILTVKELFVIFLQLNPTALPKYDVCRGKYCEKLST